MSRPGIARHLAAALVAAGGFVALPGARADASNRAPAAATASPTPSATLRRARRPSPATAESTHPHGDGPVDVASVNLRLDLDRLARASDSSTTVPAADTPRGRDQLLLFRDRAPRQQPWDAFEELGAFALATLTAHAPRVATYVNGPVVLIPDWSGSKVGVTLRASFQ